ncbi:TetR/AcrR family transcriptional regulator [Aurantiacibacter odishensis]|uniref:TetR/AcrR family transcriptional regulator n=1 Tax=Aurantiacibacter odishensis TaxID=1155476 RepID=UPI001F0BE01C|nr:TetR/AcrR family transcriptional regulator [Aurantiacibacter odishensis]
MMRDERNPGRADRPTSKKPETKVHRTRKGTNRRVPSRYTSVAMRDRRQRIINVAHKLLGEGGIEGLTIARLSREADVAPRTIYRLFDDKDGVIFATVAERMREVREVIASKKRDYTLDVVFEELDWMVDEMERDVEYAKVVIGFNFSLSPRIAEIRELRSVAYNRFRNWLDNEIMAGNTRQDLDLERIAQRHVVTEFLAYRRWATGTTAGAETRLELRCTFLMSASVVLIGSARDRVMELLSEYHGRLTVSEIGSQASTNRTERDSGKEFVGRRS